MTTRFPNQRFRMLAIGAAVVLALAAVAGTRLNARASVAPSSTQAPATPVSVATVERRDVVAWDEFSGRLEAVERVEIRSRVSGVVRALHFREGAIVRKGDLLISIDPDPYAAEVERMDAQVMAMQARTAHARSELERARRLWEERAVSQREFDERTNAAREAEAELRAAQAALRTARLSLEYTQVRAPVAGRVGRAEITVGNVVAAGPGAPVLTTLVSVDPIYASFDADEGAMSRALDGVAAELRAQSRLDTVPVRMTSAGATALEGRLQFVDNQIDARSGTVRARAVFANPNGTLTPGQFARVRIGQSHTMPALLVSERAIGTDQSKRYVMVVDAANKASYREVTLGPVVDNLRVVASGLQPGERVVVNGLQRVRPGSVVAPTQVGMDAPSVAQARNEVAARP